jgi:hypothetical protein
MNLINQVIDELCRRHGDKNTEIAAKLSENAPKKISPQRIGQYRKGKKKPGADFIRLWSETFGDKIMDEVEKRETKVSHETIKSTPVKKPNDNKEMADTHEIPDAPKIITDLVESKTEYRLVHKAILDGEYRIMLKSEIEKVNQMALKALDAKDDYIKSLNDIIADLRAKVPAPPQQTQ